MSNEGSAFGQTFQHITTIKLRELERQRETCVKYVQDTLLQATAAENPISRLNILLERIHGWSGTGLASLTSTDINLSDYRAWHHQALHDPSISSSQVEQWVSTLEEQIKQAVTRYDYAKLFGDLLKEWLQSGDSLAVVDDASSDEVPVLDYDSTKPERAERVEQRDRIQDLIFHPKHIDVPALQAYLSDLFSSPEASTALDVLRSTLQKFGDNLLLEEIPSCGPGNMESLINSLISEDLLSPQKTTILKSFLASPAILNEVKSVVEMRLARLDTWEWPAEGVFVEMRRQLSGKYRAYMDHEVIEALLFQYIGMKWSIAMKHAFHAVMYSKAWKSEIPALSRDKLARRRQFRVDDPGSPHTEDVNSYVMKGRTRGRGHPRGRGRGGLSIGEGERLLTAEPLIGSIQAQRKSLQSDQFFVTQLADTVEGKVGYSEEPNDGEVKANPASSAQQVLLRLISTEAHLKRSLHGSCTIMRADLEWFGPSLPHESILTVLRFFGMPDKWVNWLEKWLAARLTFENSPHVRIRARGVPISHVLSAICGEAILFGMDFAVNQRAQGLYVYRIFDDFWFLSHSGQLCADAWREMQAYASLVGITFNAKKTAGVCVGGDLEPSLPRGSVAWGFLVFDAEKGRFAIDQKSVDVHILELKRQLEKPKSIFGFVNVLNKYMEFFRRNFGQPAHCFGKVHVDEIVQTFERIQHAIFEEHSGSVVKKLQSMVEVRFGIKDIPAGWCFFPVAEGGLEVINPIIQLLVVRDSLVSPPEGQFHMYMKMDKDKYEEARMKWMNGVDDQVQAEKSVPESFMSFEEYILGREDRLAYWGSGWKIMQEAAFSTFFQSWDGSDVKQWVVSLYAEEIKKYFGGLQIVEPTLIPVGMLSAFRTSKIAWDS